MEGPTFYSPCIQNVQDGQRHVSLYFSKNRKRPMLLFARDKGDMPANVWAVRITVSGEGKVWRIPSPLFMQALAAKAVLTASLKFLCYPADSATFSDSAYSNWLPLELVSNWLPLELASTCLVEQRQSKSHPPLPEMGSS